MSAVSQAKLSANRANAQQSTGPKTEAGKAKVSLNAVKTGLTGRTILLPSDDVTAYQTAVARFTERWQPQTEEERILVQALTDTDWRLQRIPALEYGVYAMGEREFVDDFADEADPNIRRSLIQTQIFIQHRRELMNLQTQESRLRRHRQQDETRLQEIQTRRKGKEFERQRREAAQQAPAHVAIAPASAVAAAASGGFEFPNSPDAVRALAKNGSTADILNVLRGLREQMEQDLTEDLQKELEAA
jgi:hypothetical protein